MHPDILWQLAAAHTRPTEETGGPVKPATPSGVGWQLT